jgi:hypothetical protein
VLEIESLQNYILIIEKDAKNDGMLKLIIEDRIKRFDLRFTNPHMDTNSNNIYYMLKEKKECLQRVQN